MTLDGTLNSTPKPGGDGEGAFPAAEAAARECLALPMFPSLTAAEVRYVCASIADFF